MKVWVRPGDLIGINIDCSDYYLPVLWNKHRVGRQPGIQQNIESFEL